MKFFLDENFPRKAVQLLEADRHQVFDIRGTELEGIADGEIFEKAQENDAIFLTTDKDFYHTITHLYPAHNGIIVFALSQPNAANILEKLKAALRFIQTHKIKSNCLLLTDRKIYFTDK